MSSLDVVIGLSHFLNAFIVDLVEVTVVTVGVRISLVPDVVLDPFLDLSSGMLSGTSIGTVAVIVPGLGPCHFGFVHCHQTVSFL
jgi:hypothetical protein